MSEPRKLKSAEVKSVRLDLLAKQGYRCAICQHPCTEDEAVLDHCHKGGQIRAVLHRGCNALLGRNENNAPRHGLKLDQLIDFLKGASDFLDLHRSNVSGLIHPGHFTKEEKLAKRKAKAKRAKLKASAVPRVPRRKKPATPAEQSSEGAGSS